MSAVVLTLVAGCKEPHSKVPNRWSEWVEDSVASVGGPAAIVELLRENRRGSEASLLVLGGLPKNQRERRADRIRAQALIRDGFVERGLPAVDMTKPVDWGANPKGDRNWHYLLNSMRPLETLFRAYAGTKDERFYTVARDVVFDWIDYNFVDERKNAMKWYDMAAGFRALAIVNVLETELRRETSKTEDIGKLLWAAKIHMDFLRDPENLPRGNHGIFMMMGLKALALRIPELKDSKSARQYAGKQLFDLLAMQYSKEGVHLENSPGYHLFVTESLRELLRMGLFADEPQVQELVERATDLEYLMFHPNRETVLIGDTETRSPKGSTSHIDFVRTNGESGSPPNLTGGILRDVGYAIFRSSWEEKPFSDHSFLFFAASGHPKGHRHADTLTFEWSERGTPILVDSGKYIYRKNDEWRDFFLSTRAGNTVEIDARNDALGNEDAPGSVLRGGGTLRAKLHWAEASVRRKPSGVLHRRLLAMSEDHWLMVVDVLQADSSHRYTQWFGFNEQIEVKPDAKGFRGDLPGGQGSIFVRSTATGGGSLVRGQGGNRPQGWISRRYMKKQPRYSLGLSGAGEEQVIVTVLALDEPAQGLDVVKRGEAISVRFTHKGRKQAFSYDSSKGSLTPSEVPR